MGSSDFPAGTIIVRTNTLARFTQFHISLMDTQLPPGTVIRYSGDENLNDDLIESQGEWAWFLTDDTVFSSDALLKLLATKKDIVVPLVLDELPPYVPMAYESIDENGKYVPVNMSKHKPGLVEIVGASLSGMLVNKQVFLDVLHPWFEVGKINSQNNTQDLYFCQKARREGFKVFVDTSICLSKITLSRLSPLFVADKDKWAIQVDVNGAGVIIPIDQA